MVIIIGFIIILGGTIVGFMMAGGTIGLLIHPAETVSYTHLTLPTKA